MTFQDAPDFISVKDSGGDWLFKFTVATGRMLLVFQHPLAGFLFIFSLLFFLSPSVSLSGFLLLLLFRWNITWEKQLGLSFWTILPVGYVLILESYLVEMSR